MVIVEWSDLSELCMIQLMNQLSNDAIPAPQHLSAYLGSGFCAAFQNDMRLAKDHDWMEQQMFKLQITVLEKSWGSTADCQ